MTNTLRILLGCLMVFVFAQKARAQAEELMDAEPPKPDISRWAITGELGFQMQPNPYVKGAWTYSMIESPIATVGGRFRVYMPKWHGFIFYVRSDLVYTQETYDIQTTFGSASLTSKKLAVRGLGEADYQVFRNATVFLALGIASPPLYRTYSMSVRGYDIDLMEDKSSMDGVTQLGFSYMFHSQVNLWLAGDFKRPLARNYMSTGIVAGLAYGL